MSNDINRDGMDGNFLGGGVLEHVVHEGEIYLNADQLATLFVKTGYNWSLAAIQYGDYAGAVGANLLMILSEKFDALRMELLKREIETSFFPPVAEQDEPGN